MHFVCLNFEETLFTAETEGVGGGKAILESLNLRDFKGTTKQSFENL